MPMLWKTKAVLRNLMGKGQQGYINSNVSPCIGYVSAEVPEYNPANAYANLVGTIYLEEWGRYGEGHSGKIYIWDLPSAYGGAYANR